MSHDKQITPDAAPAKHPHAHWLRPQWQVELPPYNRCPQCGYDLHASPDRSTCSECGLHTTWASFVTRRVWGRAGWWPMLALLCLVQIVATILPGFMAFLVRGYVRSPAILIVPGLIIGSALVAWLASLRVDRIYVSSDGIHHYRRGHRISTTPWPRVSGLRLRGERDGCAHIIGYEDGGMPMSAIHVGRNHRLAQEAFERMLRR